MIRDLILDTEPTKETVGEIDLNLGANAPLRTDGEDIAENEHSDHQDRIDRRSTGVGVIGRQLLVHPAQIEHRIDPANQMVRRNNLVEVELVEQLPLPILSPPHHRRPT